MNRVASSCGALRRRRRPHPAMAVSLCATLLLAACGEDPQLLLRLRTDLVAQADYAEARIVVSGVSAGIEDELTRLTRVVARDEGREVRLGEVGPLPAGDYRVEVELWTEFGSRVAANRVLVQVRGLTVVTIPITANCAGLTCPDRGAGPDATFCLGGTCVPETCREDRAAAGCPAAECAADSDCTSAVECAEPRCDEGVCVDEPNDERCGADEICSARLGCLPIDSGGPCTPGSCDDFNPCTDDVCGDDGCMFTANTAPCDDGVFCTGSDRCEAGLCSVNDGDPCAGIGACEEATQTCAGADVCGADERVLSGACTPCPGGTQNALGDDPAGPDTECTATLCAADERVLSNACFPCPAGASNAPGDDASGPDTVCVVNACEVARRVASNMCVPCPTGETNDAGDDPTGPDTSCEAVVCPADFRVMSNACTMCPEGETNPAGDPANGPDTTCDCVETLREDTAAPFVEWYAGGDAFDAGGRSTFRDTDFYRRTLPARADERVGVTTRGVLNDFLQFLYWREFSRPIEPEGLRFWAGEYAAGAHFASLRSSILASGESESTTVVQQSCGTRIENTCDADGSISVREPYASCREGRVYARDDMGRGTAGEPTYYFAGTTMPDVTARGSTTYGVLNSFIDNVYRDGFARPVDCAGLTFWAGAYVSNDSWTLSRLEAEMIGAGTGERSACTTGEDKDCVDFTLDTCGEPI